MCKEDWCEKGAAVGMGVRSEASMGRLDHNDVNTEIHEEMMLLNFTKHYDRHFWNICFNENIYKCDGKTTLHNIIFIQKKNKPCI